jgi:hypothetical protein
MDVSAWRMLFWTPRVLTVAFILFLGIFALDVFGQGYSFLQTVAALAMHLVPNLLLLAILLVAWRWEWVGALLYAGLAIFYLVATWGRFHWSAYAVISGALGVLALLFLLNWIYHDQVRSLTPGSA